MRINLSENRICRIVSETLNRFILKETFTNMKELYHGTPLDELVNMIRVNSFFLMPSNHAGRGGKYYASLTRHKNTIEGFDALAYASETKENPIESYGIITFNIPKLTRVHGISIKPFDYYGTPSGFDDDLKHMGSPFDEDDELYDDYDDYESKQDVFSKVAYQKLKKPRELMSSEEFDSLYDYDDPEYYNMAEENIVSDTVKEIPNIFNYIDRIDVYFPIEMIKSHKEFSPYSDEYEEIEDTFGYDLTYSYAHALCNVVCGTPWENKIVVNFMGSNAPKQAVSIVAFQKWLEQKEDYKTHANKAKGILNKNPKERDGFSDYYDYGEEEYFE